MTNAGKTTRPSKGFTIIEVLVVVAILAVLAAIAIPAYTKYVTSARRADGKSALVAAAQAMERYYTNCYTYGSKNGTSCNGADIPDKSDQELYNLTVTVANATAFTIQAVADPDEKQANDALCKTMTINQLGVKGAKNAQNADTTDDCWK
jgi:type IV pilus assembly protein PilE